MQFPGIWRWSQQMLAAALVLAAWPAMAQETAEPDQETVVIPEWQKALEQEASEADEQDTAAPEPIEPVEPLALDALIERGEFLMARGRAGRAWELLSPREGEFAGEVAYDYLLGTAALDTARPAAASLAFERILIQRPNHAGARMGLARAWFAMGDYERARAEFETLRDMQPPERARMAIERYLAAIDDRTLPPVRTRLTGHVQAGGGYDSNVNRATDQETVAIPALGNLEIGLSEESQESDDGYGQIEGGVLLEHALSEAVALYGGVDGSTRAHFSESDFNTLRGDLRAGARLRTERHFYTTGVSYGQLWVDGDNNRRTLGVNAEWRWLATSRDQIAVFTRGTRFRHPDLLDIQDADQFLLGASWLRNIGEGGRTRLSLTFLGGTEDAFGGRDDGDKRIAGLRAGIQQQLHQDVLLVASGGWREDRYEDENSTFLRERQDRPADVSLNLDWQLAADWRLQPEISYLDHDSNIPVNDYDRVEASLTLRRDFR